VEAGPAPLAAALPAPLGLHTAGWYARAGVDLVLREAVTVVEADRVNLASGRSLAADVVVCAVGVRPDTAWLHGSGVPLGRTGAVEVDETLATGTPGVVAVGDCAAWLSRRYGARLHVEHWDTALHGPAAATATLLGAPTAYDPVPYFWSEQLGHTLQYVGHHAGADSVVERPAATGDPDSWIVFWVSGDRLVAALACDRPRDLVQARRLAEREVPVDSRRLADPSVAVRDTLA
ncbi:MAG: FAD-dependent oxidoreductase, partial [Actinomycetota bacterium]|nr:FAD-dependent oxidoreductase [Actinomycetota bacterium]